MNTELGLSCKKLVWMFRNMNFMYLQWYLIIQSFILNQNWLWKYLEYLIFSMQIHLNEKEYNINYGNIFSNNNSFMYVCDMAKYKLNYYYCGNETNNIINDSNQTNIINNETNNIIIISTMYDKDIINNENNMNDIETNNKNYYYVICNYHYWYCLWITIIFINISNILHNVKQCIIKKYFQTKKIVYFFFNINDIIFITIIFIITY